jgi:membrane carboxypeptidase/penicillin-binding protein PbpC
MSGINPNFRGAVKTGTMHDFSGCWSLGYTGRIGCGVWTGFLQGSGKPIYEGAFGKDVALPIWKAAMNALSEEYLNMEITKPSSIVKVEVCRVSGQRASEYCYESVMDSTTNSSKLRDAHRNEYFRLGTERIPVCPVHAASVVSNSDILINSTTDIAVIDAIPIRAKKPLLIGKDPYQSEIVKYSLDNEDELGEGAFYRSSDTFIDMLELGDEKSQLPLETPGKLELELEIE